MDRFGINYYNYEFDIRKMAEKRDKVYCYLLSVTVTSGPTKLILSLDSVGRF